MTTGERKAGVALALTWAAIIIVLCTAATIENGREVGVDADSLGGIPASQFATGGVSDAVFGSHTSNVSAHHTRYTDAEATQAVGAAFVPTNTFDGHTSNATAHHTPPAGVSLTNRTLSNTAGQVTLDWQNLALSNEVAANLVVNGTFDTDLSSWGTNQATHITNFGGACEIFESGSIEQTVTVVSGRTYRIVFETKSGTSANTGLLELGATNRLLADVSSPAFQTNDVVAVESGSVTFRLTYTDTVPPVVWNIDNITFINQNPGSWTLDGNAVAKAGDGLSAFVNDEGYTTNAVDTNVFAGHTNNKSAHHTRFTTSEVTAAVSNAGFASKSGSNVYTDLNNFQGVLQKDGTNTPTVASGNRVQADARTATNEVVTNATAAVLLEDMQCTNVAAGTYMVFFNCLGTIDANNKLLSYHIFVGGVEIHARDITVLSNGDIQSVSILWPVTLAAPSDVEIRWHIDSGANVGTTSDRSMLILRTLTGSLSP